MRLYKIKFILFLILFPNFYLIGAKVQNKQLFSPDWDELVEYMSPKAYSLNELNAAICMPSTQGVKFRATHSSIIIGRNYNWEEFRDKKNLICVKLHTPNIGFLNEKQTKSFLTAHSGHKINLNWSTKLLLKYYMFRDRFCDFSYEYKPSESKGLIKRVNLCGIEQLVQGNFVFNVPIIK